MNALRRSLVPIVLLTILIGNAAAENKRSRWTLADNKLALDYRDLGFSRKQTRPNKDLQMRLEKRSRMLKTHQTLGLITAGLLMITVATGEPANRPGKDFHLGAGIATGVMYATAATYAIRAPSVEGVARTGPTKWHRRLAYVHIPLMVLTPILGAAARRQRDHNEELHSFGKWHGPVGFAAAGTFLASMIVVSVNF